MAKRKVAKAAKRVPAEGRPSFAKTPAVQAEAAKNWRKAMAVLDVRTAIGLPEAAALAGVTPRWVRLEVDAGRMIGAKVGRNYLVDPASARAYVRRPPGRKKAEG